MSEFDNPMESEDLVMMYVYEDVYLHRAYSIALKGPYLKASYESREVLAKKLGVPPARLESCNSVHLGQAVEFHSPPFNHKPPLLPRVLK